MNPIRFAWSTQRSRHAGDGRNTSAREGSDSHHRLQICARSHSFRPNPRDTGRCAQCDAALAPTRHPEPPQLSLSQTLEVVRFGIWQPLIRSCAPCLLVRSSLWLASAAELDLRRPVQVPTSALSNCRASAVPAVQAPRMCSNSHFHPCLRLTRRNTSTLHGHRGVTDLTGLMLATAKRPLCTPRARHPTQLAQLTLRAQCCAPSR